MQARQRNDNTNPSWLKGLSGCWVVCPVDLEHAFAVYKLLVDDIFDGKHLIAHRLMTHMQPSLLGENRRR